MSEQYVTFEGRQAEVLGRNGAWTQLLFEDGSTRKVRLPKGAKSNGTGPAKAAVSKAAKKPAKKVAKKPVGEADGRALRYVGKSQVTRFQSYEPHVTAAGNIAYDNGDKVALELREMPLDDIYRLVAKTLKDDLGVKTIDEAEALLRKRYAKLNAGMQRMNLGNRYRAACR